MVRLAVSGCAGHVVDDREIMVTHIEFNLLRFMAISPNEWHATQDLLAGVWNYPDGVGDTTGEAVIRGQNRLTARQVVAPDHRTVGRRRVVAGRQGCGVDHDVVIPWRQSGKEVVSGGRSHPGC